MIGGAIGGSMVVRLPPAVLQIGLGIFIIWSTWGRPPVWRSSSLAIAGTGLVSTFLTMFFGATGVFVAAIIKPLGLDRLALVGTHAACMSIQHGVKVAAFGLIGFAYSAYLPLILLMIASGILGILAGRYVLARTADERFHVILSWLLTALAARLLWQGGASVVGMSS